MASDLAPAALTPLASAFGGGSQSPRPGAGACGLPPLSTTFAQAPQLPEGAHRRARGARPAARPPGQLPPSFFRPSQGSLGSGLSSAPCSPLLESPLAAAQASASVFVPAGLLASASQLAPALDDPPAAAHTLALAAQMPLASALHSSGPPNPGAGASGIPPLGAPLTRPPAPPGARRFGSGPPQSVQSVLPFLPRLRAPGLGPSATPGAGACGVPPLVPASWSSSPRAFIPGAGACGDPPLHHSGGPGAGARGLPPPVRTQLEVAPPARRGLRRRTPGSGPHSCLIVAFRAVCLACGRSFDPDPCLEDCPGWAPFLSASASRLLSSQAAVMAISALPPRHFVLAAALRRGLLRAPPPLLRPLEPD